MNTTEFLAYLHSIDVRIGLDGDELLVNAPRDVLTAELRGELSKRKPEVMDFLRRIRGAAERHLPAIQPVPRDGFLPLSFPQQRMWLMQQFEADGAAFNTPAAVRLSGPLDIPALEAGLNEIVRRHEVLRTVFVSENADVFQKIIPELKVTLPVVDLRDISGDKRKAKAGELFEEEAGKAFDLSQGPLLRALLLREGEREYVLFITLHHIVSDDWSLNILLREMEILYEAYSTGTQAPLSKLPVQYGDFAVWQREWVRGEAAGKQKNYWKQRLNHTKSLPEIPVDHPNPRKRTGRRARHALSLSPDLSKQLKTLSTQERSTLFMTLLAAFKILLHQYSHRTDIVVAAPIAGRTHSELEKLIGFFVNTVILRTDLSGDPSFRRLLARVREVTSGAHANQAIPFEEVVKELRADAVMERIHVFFNMLNTASQQQAINLRGLKTGPFLDSLVRAPEIGGGFDLTLIAVERGGRICLDASFNTDVFERKTIAWLLAHFHALLKCVAAAPDTLLSALPPLSPLKPRLVKPGNDFERFPGRETGQSLARRFEKQVARYPDRVAVEADGQGLTYDGLNRLANRLARVIQERYDDRLRLSGNEKIRYARQILLWGRDGQEKLKDTTVFVAGAGGTGSPVLMQLALCGVGTLIVCDGDDVDLSNLNRQFLHDETRIGMNKALSARMTLNRINPHINIIAYEERITRENVRRLVGGSAIIFDNVDDLETKFILSECAVSKGIPHIISSMIDLSSYAAVFHPPLTPCFHCLYDRAKVEEIKAMRPGASDDRRVPNPVASPALFASTGFACNEGIKIILGLENPAYNKYFFFNQKGTPQLVATQGFQIVTYPFSAHFKRISREQGFDWDKGWSGRFIEEITLKPDPACPICGSRAGADGGARFSIALEGTEPDHEPKNQGIKAVNEEQRTVALLLGHDQEMLAGILGVLKAGMIFAAFDSGYPEHRLTAMLEDSDARLIVANPENLPLAQKIRDKVNKNIGIMNIDDIPAAVSDKNPGVYPHPDHIAYIVYTSGSTGKPKGVTQSHRNVLHFIMNYTNGLHISSDDRLSLIPTFSFSAAMMDTFAALLNGAALYPYDVRRRGLAGLGAWLAENEITVYHSVPTVFRQFTAGLGDNMAFPRLRLIDFGGEPVTEKDVQLYKKHFSTDCILVNGLGATELNVIRQYYIDKQTRITGPSVPVGYEVSDTEILLLDEERRTVGFNRPGEIVIKSAYLSPGYWQSPEQTRAVFKPDPRCEGRRLYFTGDLGRMRPDGCLEHLGRRDLQVKIRGVRIELAEIEGVLGEVEGIREAAVAAKENQAGERILAAYIVPEDGQAEFPLEQVRSILLERLPAYMLPSEFVLLNALPLTHTGKVDRRVLPAAAGVVVAGAGSGQQDYAAPDTGVEKVLAGIWAEILGVERIGIHDGFFDLGGDSLLALRALDRMRQAGLRFTSRQLFQHDTIAELAALAETPGGQADEAVCKQAGAGPAPNPDRTGTGKGRTGTAGPIPVTPGTFWCEEKRVFGKWWQFFEWLIEVPKELDAAMLRRVAEALVRRHESLRLRMVFDENSPLGLREFIVDPADDHTEYFICHDIAGLSEEEREKAILSLRDLEWGGMSLEKGPTVKFVYFDLGPQKQARLMIMVHHFAADAYSITILHDDFNTACRQVMGGKPVSLAAPSTTLREWAEKMYEYVLSEEAQRELDYHRSLPWDKAGIPLDYPDVPVCEADSEEFTITLNARETKDLLRYVPAEYNVNIMDILLTGFLIAAGHCWKGVSTLAFETFDSNRGTDKGMDLSRLVGFLSQTHDEVLSIDPEAGIRKTLQNVHRQRSMIPGNGINWQWTVAYNYDLVYSYFPPQGTIRFNYLGHQTQRSGLFRSFPLPPHKPMMKKRIERVRFECWASTMEDIFSVKWRYYPAYHKEDTVKRFSREYLNALRSFIENK
jgi:amino acid adenylation domain-containing protein